MTEVWDPNAEHQKLTYVIEKDFLQEVIQRMALCNDDNIESLFTTDEKISHQAIMRQTKEAWFTAIDDLTESNLLTLIRFFTLAEVQYDNWTADDNSPVIWLAKRLRQQSKSLDKELLKWIKMNNPNKFLPFGPLM